MVQFTELKYIEMWTDKSFASTWMSLMTLKNSWSGYTQKHNELIFLYLIAGGLQSHYFVWTDGLGIAAVIVNVPVVLPDTDFLAFRFWHGHKTISAVPFLICAGCFYSCTTDV